VQLAKFMQQHVCAATGRANGGAHQDNLAVLRLSSMPGCLLELGFISTKDEEQFMNSKDAPQKYARGVYNAFTAYKKKYHGGATSTPFLEAPTQEASLAPQQAEPRKQQTTKKRQEQSLPEQKQEAKQETTKQEQKQEAKPEAAKPDIADAKDEPVFKVQITTSDRKLSSGNSRLKGVEDADSYFENGLYKYTVGSSTNYNEIYLLRKTLLGKFPDAFIIAFKNGQKMNVQEAIREFKSNKNKK
jgi:N-acetylmuramoyl-L-alanine amidase